MYSLFIVVYLFLGGCSAGLLFVACIWRLVFERRALRGLDRLAESNQANLCMTAGFIITVAASLCLIYDLLQPSRAILLFLRPTLTLLSMGSFALLAQVLLSGFLTFGAWLHTRWMKPWMTTACTVACLPVALVVMAYTGFFLQGISAIAFWNTPAVPALFVASSFSMGLAAFALIGALGPDGKRLGPAMRLPHRLHLAAVVCEIAALALFVWVSATASGRALHSLYLLLGPELGSWFFGGVVLCGLGIPFATELYQALMRRSSTYPLVELGCLLGGFALRYCIFMAGLH